MGHVLKQSVHWLWWCCRELLASTQIIETERMKQAVRARDDEIIKNMQQQASNDVTAAEWRDVTHSAYRRALWWCQRMSHDVTKRTVSCETSMDGDRVRDGQTFRIYVLIKSQCDKLVICIGALANASFTLDKFDIIAMASWGLDRVLPSFFMLHNASFTVDTVFL